MVLSLALFSTTRALFQVLPKKQTLRGDPKSTKGIMCATIRLFTDDVILTFFAHICSLLDVTKHRFLLETYFLYLSTILDVARNLLLDPPFGLLLVLALALKRLYSANLWITVIFLLSDPPALTLLCVLNRRWCIDASRNDLLQKRLVFQTCFRPPLTPLSLGLHRSLTLGSPRQT